MREERRPTRIALISVVVVIGAAAALADDASSAASIAPDFAREVRPILAAKCFDCHGPDRRARKARLRLDTEEGALGPRRGGAVIVPGKAAESELYRRVITDDEDELMPPPESKRALSEAEREVLRRWIDGGASFDRHWAYVAPVGSEELRELGATGAIDRHIARRLREAGLEANPPAAREQLLRRLSLDLVGLPPDPDEVLEFLADEEPEAVEKRIDALLASPGFGERWARPWLDLARYADSNGFQADQLRESWAYRDWVIDALACDLPFDEFTVQQIAGDLLPEADLRSRIATGFHRTVPCNVEAGVHPEENRTQQVFDRVNTTGTVWLGTTLECAQCHDHKYDPFTTRDYYSLFAYFNSTPIEVRNPNDGKGVQFDFAGPSMELPLSADRRARKTTLEERIRELEAARAEHRGSEDLPRVGEEGPRDPELERLDEELAVARRELEAIRPATTLVMVELETPRETRILRRGSYLDPGDVVSPGTPAALPSLAEDLPATRLGLARWLTDPAHPLVARVAVNRWWAELFGSGIVATLEDFGTQSSPPSHPRVLDDLAVDLVEGGWSMKRVLRRVVLTEAYRRSSRVSASLLEEDPENRLLARAPRTRLAAESIRDLVLRASGLLSLARGGPPVMPVQPDGIWRHVGRNAPKWRTEEGERRYRRGVYVVWRRSAPYPSFVAFDAPDRSACVVARPSTNTPLQALALLNDPAMHEAAVALARRVLTSVDASDDGARVELAFLLVVSRRPTPEEVRILEELVAERRARLSDEAARAARIASLDSSSGHGDAPLDSRELAAWTYIASVLLNTDETITRE